jgi:type VI secretion system (T6SS) phospholipase Tle1-like effector
LRGRRDFPVRFSRGAYTARSVAGLIGYAGLIGKRDLDRFFELWDGYRTVKKPDHVDPLPKFAGRHENVVIKCIGVWDTVGSLGVPGNIDFLFKDYYAFHNTDLGARVDSAFHALALDERREDFVPALWQQKPEGKARGQVLKQVWFAGAHSDVGGGYPEHGLSDIALAWMASQIEPMLGIDFDYLRDRRDLSSQWSLGMLHDSVDGIFKTRGKVVRTPLAKDRTDSFESIHPSVAERVKGGAGASPGPYTSGALTGIDLAANPGKLSDRETDLQWSAQDVKPAAQQAKKAFSIRRKLINLIGGS